METLGLVNEHEEVGHGGDDSDDDGGGGDGDDDGGDGDDDDDGGDGDGDDSDDSDDGDDSGDDSGDDGDDSGGDGDSDGDDADCSLRARVQPHALAWDQSDEEEDWGEAKRNDNQPHPPGGQPTGTPALTPRVHYHQQAVSWHLPLCQQVRACPT